MLYVTADYVILLQKPHSPTVSDVKQVLTLADVKSVKDENFDLPEVKTVSADVSVQTVPFKSARADELKSVHNTGPQITGIASGIESLEKKTAKNFTIRTPQECGTFPLFSPGETHKF